MERCVFRIFVLMSILVTIVQKIYTLIGGWFTIVEKTVILFACCFNSLLNHFQGILHVHAVMFSSSLWLDIIHP
jgi:hypothetical protein